MTTDEARRLHRSTLRAFSAAILHARTRARHFRAPVVVIDIDRAVIGTVWTLEGAQDVGLASQRGAARVAFTLAQPGSERATRVIILSREGASLWLADGEPHLTAEHWHEDGDSLEDRKTEPLMKTR